MNLQAKGLQSVEYAYKLMRSKENSGYFAVVTAQDKAEARQLTERLEKLPAVDHVVSLLALVPDQQEAKLAELAALKQVMAEVKPVPYEENLRVMELPTVFENFRDRVDKLKKALETQQGGRGQAGGGLSGHPGRFFQVAGKGEGQERAGYAAGVSGGDVCRTARQAAHDEGESGGGTGQRGRCAGSS